MEAHGPLQGREMVWLRSPLHQSCIVYVLRVGMAFRDMVSKTGSEVTPTCSGSHSTTGSTFTSVRSWNAISPDPKVGKGIRGMKAGSPWCSASQNSMESLQALETHGPDCTGMASLHTQLASSPFPVDSMKIFTL